MPSVNFNDRYPEPNGRMAAQFLYAWWGSSRDDWLVNLSRINTRSNRLLPTTASKADILGAFENSALADFVLQGGDNWNLYHSVGFMRATPQAGRRGGKSNVRAVPGVWLDLDTKEGCFRDEAHALEFVATLPIEPSILVATGTGGVHAYWKTNKMLTIEQAEELGLRWWTLAKSMTTAHIDKIQNADRIMRTPGSVRWPKDSSEMPALVRNIKLDGPWTTVSDLEEATEEVWQAALSEKHAIQSATEYAATEARELAGELTGWDVLYAIAFLEEKFNNTYTWDDIIVQHGWECIGTDGENRRIWSRPQGYGRKAATTDWVASPHVMSLFSDAPETRLAHLKEMGIPLTKYRVHIALTWNGDERGFVEQYVNLLRTQGKT